MGVNGVVGILIHLGARSNSNCSIGHSIKKFPPPLAGRLHPKEEKEEGFVIRSSCQKGTRFGATRFGGWVINNRKTKFIKKRRHNQKFLHKEYK